MREILEPLGITVLVPDDVGGLPDVIEDRDTFAGNAAKKAEEGCVHTGEWVLADDSGIEARALDWAPGVYSARYAGSHGDDAANNAKLAAALADESDRYVQYRCVIALARPGEETLTWDGIFPGEFIEPRGAGRLRLRPARGDSRVRQNRGRTAARGQTRAQSPRRSAASVRRMVPQSGMSAEIDQTGINGRAWLHNRGGSMCDRPTARVAVGGYSSRSDPSTRPWSHEPCRRPRPHAVGREAGGSGGLVPSMNNADQDAVVGGVCRRASGALGDCGHRGLAVDRRPSRGAARGRADTVANLAGFARSGNRARADGRVDRLSHPSAGWGDEADPAAVILDDEHGGRVEVVWRTESYLDAQRTAFWATMAVVLRVWLPSACSPRPWWRIARPVESLARAAAHRRGTWHEPVPQVGSGEVRDLAVDLEAMRRRLAALDQHNRRSERLATLGTFTATIAHEVRNPLSAAVTIVGADARTQPRR